MWCLSHVITHDDVNLKYRYIILSNGGEVKSAKYIGDWTNRGVVSSQVGVAHCALECKPKVDWNKGNASLLILEKEFGTEWEKR